MTRTGAEIKVYSTIGVKSALEELGPKFEKATGNKLNITWGLISGFTKKAQEGDVPDVLVVSRAGIDSLIKDGKIASGSDATLAKSVFAIAVKRGAPKPDISSPEALKSALLAARAVGYGDPAAGGASGVQFAKVLERLGIAPEIKAKSKFPPPAGFVGTLLVSGEIDIAVHSMKDVPTEFPEGLGLYCITEREDPRDAVISRGVKFADLPQGARIGTSALRRQAQLLKVRPDMEMVIIRGNVETRINKLETEKLDAVILAAAGLKRLGFTDRVTEYLDTDLSIPAIGQGALGIECRLDNEEVKQTIDFFNHPATSHAVRAERALLWRCEGGCQVPIAAHGVVTGNELTLTGFVASVDGKKSVKGSITGPAEQCEKLGITLAEQLLKDGAYEILAEVYQREVAREKEIPV